MTDSNPLRERILKTLGQQGALSLKGITTILRPQEPKTIETELKTMVRRKLCAEPFEGSFELTERGRKEYGELVKHIPKRTMHPVEMPPAPFGGFPVDQQPYGPPEPFQYEETDEDDEEEDEEEYCDECDWPLYNCHCDDEEEEDDDDDY